MSLQKSVRPPLPIAVTMGDPAGISTEITAQAWISRQQNGLSPFFVLTRGSLFEKLGQYSDIQCPIENIDSPIEAMDAFENALPVIELPDEIVSHPGQPAPSSGAMTIHSITKAVEYIKKGEASSLVTNPINKHVLYQAGFEFPGHTEYLAKLAEQWGLHNVRPVMMLASRHLRTVPLTIHIPLEKVAEQITTDLIIETAHTISDDLKKYFGLRSPRLAVTGLNPHAGENGAMGTAEIKIIEPAIRSLQAEGITVTGPHPADTLFHEAARKNYDVVLGMYHDQALIPIKTLSFDEGVNTTLGLPFVRTSPDHGTAYNIAGKGQATPKSLIEALRMAKQMSDHLRKTTPDD